MRKSAQWYPASKASCEREEGRGAVMDPLHPGTLTKNFDGTKRQFSAQGFKHLGVRRRGWEPPRCYPPVRMAGAVSVQAGQKSHVQGGDARPNGCQVTVLNFAETPLGGRGKDQPESESINFKRLVSQPPQHPGRVSNQ